MASDATAASPTPAPGGDGEPPFGFKQLVGFVVDSTAVPTRVSLDVGPQHLNPNGVIHGAVPHALMDTAMGAACMGVLDEGLFCATVEMQVRYLRGASSGALVATAEVINAGRRIVHLEARTVDDTGRVIATATASFAVIQPPAA